MRKPWFIETKETIYYNMEKYEEDYGQFYFLDDYDTLVENIKTNNAPEYEDEDEDEIKKNSFSAAKCIYFQRTLYAITVVAAFMVFIKFV
jgi:hypothetical protein